MIKQIYLHGKYGSVIGNHALVDDEDYDELIKYKWFCGMSKQKNTTHYYAVRNINNKQQRMHRIIMQATDPKIEVDHKNHNTLDNRKTNLRLATKTQNGANQRKTRGKYPYKGVTKVGKHYAAHTEHMGKTIYIGIYDTIENAAMAYDIKMLELHGEYAYLNFPTMDYSNVEIPKSKRETNTGYNNIYYSKRDDLYQVYKTVNKVRTTKHFKSFDEAMSYLLELKNNV